MDLMQRRKVMLAAGKKSGLPSQYQAVEHLICTGTQYISTGLHMPNGFRLKAEFFATTKIGCFFGCDESNIQYRNYFSVSENATNAILGLGGSSGYLLFPLSANVWNEIDCCNIIGKRYIDLNGVLYSVTQRDYGRYADYEMTLFVLNRAGTLLSGQFCRLRAKVVKIYSDSSEDSIVRYFIPCYRKSDSKPGMYDLCGSICPLTNSPFYINAGSGEFLVGPDVN